MGSCLSSFKDPQNTPAVMFPGSAKDAYAEMSETARPARPSEEIIRSATTAAYVKKTKTRDKIRGGAAGQRLRGAAVADSSDDQDRDPLRSKAVRFDDPHAIRQSLSEPSLYQTEGAPIPMSNGGKSMRDILAHDAFLAGPGRKVHGAATDFAMEDGGRRS